MSQSVVVSRHPPLLHKLARLRDRDTDTVAFRRLVREVGYIVPGLGDAGDRQFGTH